MLYSLNDICLIQGDLSFIDHRSECIPFYKTGMLPLFTAPMSSVIGVNSVQKYFENKINPIIPRSVSLIQRLDYLFDYFYFVAFGLEEIKEYFIDNDFEARFNYKFRILIDIANGNMNKMFELVKQLKLKYKDRIIIMAGNIANPGTYKKYCEAGIDYARIGIGGGAGCLTSTNTGIHYPLASLIIECKTIKNRWNFDHSFKQNNVSNSATKIVADGGIKGYSDIIKSLALGADYVMCGSLFAKMRESEAPIIDFRKTGGINITGVEFKKFYGMSTPKAQIEMGGTGLKVTEGKEETIKVEYTMEEWVNNFKSYLTSTMSYTGKNTLNDFIGNVTYGIMSPNASNAFNK